MEQKIKEMFSTVPAVENPQERPFYAIPEHDEMYFAVATDKEAQRSMVSITTILPEKNAAEKNTHAYLKEALIQSFYNSMIASRISELMQKGDPPFINAGIGFGGLVRGYNSYGITAIAKPNQEDVALEAVLTENEKIKRFGFTESELERVKTNMLVGLESAYKEKDKTNNESYIREMQSNFLENEPIVDFEYYYEFAKQVIPTITVAEVSAKAREWNTPKNRVMIISGPSEDATHLTQEEAVAILEKVEKADLKAYEDHVRDASLISEDLPGSKIVKTKKLPQFDAEEWTLANGAKVVFRKADFDKDDVTLTSYSKGGTSLYDIDLLPSASNVGSLVGAYGLGDFDAVTLRKMLTGKMASVSVSVGSLSESVGGKSTPKDFETMLQLLYLRFEKPRFDAEAHEAIMNRNRAAIANQQKNPQKIMQDSLSLIMSDYNPRTLLFNEEYLNKISLEKIERVYRDRIKDASDFTFFIVGNISADTVKPLIEKYIGSLTSVNRKENWRDNRVRGPKGRTEKVIEIPLETPKATVVTKFSKDMKYNVYHNLCNNILEGVLKLRYTENIREKEGGTYGVSVNAGAVREPYQNYSMTMVFDCDPDRATQLKSLVYEETEKMMQEGPTAEELHKVISNIKKNREQSKQHNRYWLNNIYSEYVTGIKFDPEGYEKMLDKISPKDIQKFAQSLFKGADVVDVVFQPKK